MNNVITSCSRVTNKEVNLLLMNHFGDKITFSQPKSVSKSVIIFGQNVGIENNAETIRTTDPVRLCAENIRQCL